MLEELKQIVYEQNIALVKQGLVVLTWGNVSAKDEKTGLVVIKPSGVPYDTMKAEDMVVVDLDGTVVEGKYKPSSDLPTHLYLYKTCPSLGGVVHTHSTYATAFAQSGREIVAYGTTHADAFYGNVPISRDLTDDEIDEAYEWNTGKVIAETVSDYDAVPAVLVKNHGVFTWGATPKKAVENAVTLEEVAKMALLTEQLNPGTGRIKQHLLDKHYFRKHGKNAYYGQNS
jgi:L-ribulose-5-phosphate 4-epimerase